MISVCGDNCAVCPRYNAKSEEELHRLAQLWHRIGWRDRVVEPDEMRCSGCGSGKGCAYQLRECCAENNVERCTQCSCFPCERIAALLEKSAYNRSRCFEVCSEEEFALLDRAFYQKEKYLGLLPESSGRED